ncbi:HNH endonuclease signature motif containing protein [Pseudarthrobacter sp. NPDC058196]|uniref:HNH endonuclease signature motif containing protein n=1 Tax=Pseudarthrobacter sp. NPDC058196 TaxID=3346376 RepID=UPI0036D7CA6A
MTTMRMFDEHAAGRFWARVEFDDCWLWQTARKDKGNYGTITISDRRIVVHRWSYVYFYGEIRDRLVIDHLCMNKLCVRPDHLEAVTQAENVRRAAAAKALGRQRDWTHCSRGHEFTEENTYVAPSGGRQCRICVRARVAGEIAALTTAERFWAKVDREASVDGCWLWTAALTPAGYGACGIDGHQLAHRWSYEQSNGAIPNDLVIDHLCMVKNCVNPAHLEAVTQVENTRRAAQAGLLGSAGRAKTHCPRGHEYNDTNTYVSDGQGRRCLTCARGREAARRADLEIGARIRTRRRQHREERMTNDPEFRERRRQTSREWNRKARAENPALREKCRSYNREYMRKKRDSDPEYRERMRQYLRDYRRRKLAEDPDYYKKQRAKEKEMGR